jgi:glycosyltransferase involved in cell wall biosynthesis
MDTFVILSPGFPKNESDTSCLPTIQQFALSVKKLYPNIQIIVLSFQYPFTSGSYYWNGIEVIALGGKNKPGLFRVITWVKAYRQLQKMNKKFKLIGLLNIFYGECAYVGTKFAERNSLLYFSWLQGQDAKLNNRYVKRISSKGEHIIALSDFLQTEFFKNHHIRPKHVINNGILASAFPELNTSKRTIDILGVGSLIPLKNYSYFIEIISEIKNNFPSVKAVIAGKGEEFESLRNLIFDLQLQDNVQLLGERNHKEILDVMNNSKIVLHTSKYEGSCSVLYESLFSGCKVISTCNPSNLNYPAFDYITDKRKIINKINNILSETNISSERVLFNKMEASAKKMMNLFLANS